LHNPTYQGYIYPAGKRSRPRLSGGESTRIAFKYGLFKG
jgi:hypothetical protein